MVEAMNRNLRRWEREPVGVLLADAGYYSDRNVQGVGEAGPELVIATRSDRRRRAAAPPRGRITAELSQRERMARKVATKRGRQRSGQRRWMIDPVCGDVKGAPRYAALRSASLCRLRRQWKLVAATRNLRKLHRRAAARARHDRQAASRPAMDPQAAAPPLGQELGSGCRFRAPTPPAGAATVRTRSGPSGRAATGRHALCNSLC